MNQCELDLNGKVNELCKIKAELVDPAEFKKPFTADVEDFKAATKTVSPSPSLTQTIGFR